MKINKSITLTSSYFADKSDSDKAHTLNIRNKGNSNVLHLKEWQITEGGSYLLKKTLRISLLRKKHTEE